MHNIRDILRKKGTDVWSTSPEETVLEAIGRMAGNDLMKGASPVTRKRQAELFMKDFLNRNRWGGPRWTWSHPSARRNASCSGVSTPSATTFMRRLWASAMVAATIAALSLSLGKSSRKERSILSAVIGN